MKKARNWFWGIFLLAAAVVLIVGQVTGFAQFGFWSIAALVLLAAAFVQSLISLSFPALFFCGALIYIIIQKPLNLVYISPWLLLLAALLAGIGLAMIIRPKRNWKKAMPNGHFRQDNSHLGSGHFEDGRWVNDEPAARAAEDAVYQATYGAVEEVLEEVDEVAGEAAYTTQAMELETGDDLNHPYARVRFGGSSQYIHGQAVESALFEVSCGGMEVYFDQAKPAPGGLEITVDVSIGGIEFYFPRHWNIREGVNTSLAAVEHNQRNAAPDPTAPPVYINGDVRIGGLEIHYI